jgi:hypothetical protein
LYEGTPGGKLDSEAGLRHSSQRSENPLDEPWSEIVPWVCWAANANGPGLYESPAAGARTDRFYVSWPFEKEANVSFHDMTVFGFGRKGYKELVKHVYDLRKLPARYSIAFIDRADHAAARAVYERIVQLPPLLASPMRNEHQLFADNPRDFEAIRLDTMAIQGVAASCS